MGFSSLAKIVSAIVLLFVIIVVETRPVEDANKSPFGSPFFDEIVVESTLTVRGRGGAARQSRGKKLEVVPSTTTTSSVITSSSDVEKKTFEIVPSDGASVQLTRPKRQPQNGNNRHQGPGRRQHQQHRPNNFGGGAGQNFGGQNFGGPNFRGQGQGFGIPSASASSANAASQGFNVAGPNGFGASASNAGTQGFQIGPNGIQGSAAQSASQTYRLPNGNSLNVAFSNGFNVGPNGASQSGANTVSLTNANGQQQQLHRG